MRAVFLILLVANLLFLAWAEWIDSPRDAGAHDALSHLPRLQLIDEKPSASNSTPPPPAALAPPPAPEEKVALAIPNLPQVPRCTSIGPFNDIAHVARAAGLLTQRGFKLQQRAEEGETIEGYWVFVGGLSSDQDVTDVVARLEKNGFTDAHVMKNFSTNRRISVGMFSTRERAAKRAAAITAIGLSPEVGERKFPGTIYWVDVALANADQRPPEYLFADVGRSQQVQMQPCPAGLTQPQNDGDSPDPDKVLPRTTVASAPAGSPH